MVVIETAIRDLIGNSITGITELTDNKKLHSLTLDHTRDAQVSTRVKPVVNLAAELTKKAKTPTAPRIKKSSEQVLD